MQPVTRPEGSLAHRARGIASRARGLAPRARGLARPGLRVVAALALGFAVLSIFASNWLTGLFFGPVSGCPPPPPEAGIVELVRVPAADGAVMEGWYFPARRDPGVPPRALVVQAHGNGWNLQAQWRGAKWLADRGFDVLAFDYRGFGNSPGRATRQGAIDDVNAAIDWAQRRAARRGLRVVLFGQSMGAALSVEVGTRRADLAAIVIDSPFDSWPGVAAFALSRRAWLRAPLRLALAVALRRSGPELADVVGHVGPPLFIVSGEADRVCPPEMARNLSERAGCGLLEIAGAPHVGQRSEEQGRQAHDAIVAFLEEALARPTHPGA